MAINVRYGLDEPSGDLNRKEEGMGNFIAESLWESQIATCADAMEGPRLLAFYAQLHRLLKAAVKKDVIREASGALTTRRKVE